MNLCQQSGVSAFNMPSRFVIAFIPKNKRLNFMNAVTVCSDSGAHENKICHSFHCFPFCLPLSDGTGCHDHFLNVKPAFSLSVFTLIKRLFSSSSCSAIKRYHLHIWGCWYCSWQSWFLPACDSSSPAFLMMYSAFKLNKQGDNIQPWRTPLPIWKQSVVPCPVLTLASWPAFSGVR